MPRLKQLLHCMSSACLLMAVTMLTLYVTQAAQAQTFTVLHAFSGSDGAYPSAVPIFDRAGNLYGPTSSGTGDASNGTIYKVGPHGSGWVLSSLYHFQGGSDGAYPSSPVTFDQSGTAYSVTLNGGSDNCTPNGCGTIFKLRPPAAFCRSISCPWDETQLYAFPYGGNGDHPSGPLIFDQAGNIYGTAGGGSGLGIVYQLTPTAGGWTENILHVFGGHGDGADPNGLISDSAGNLYGTTYYAGPSQPGCGTVYEMSPSGSSWTFTVLYSFSCYDPDGGYLYGRLAIDAAGNLYGTTNVGGDQGDGTIFELSPQGGTWVHTVLYSFGAGGFSYPGTLVFDAAGNLYGVADGVGDGAVFKLTHSGNSWTYTTLHYFTGGSDGRGAVDTVVLDGSGNVYGASPQGGNDYCQYGCGTLWEITP